MKDNTQYDNFWSWGAHAISDHLHRNVRTPRENGDFGNFTILASQLYPKEACLARTGSHE